MLEAEPVIDVVDSTLSIAVELFPINLWVLMSLDIIFSSYQVSTSLIDGIRVSK
jgi:hypothetical protein